MAPQVWGTFAVNDHCPRNAFAREVLLFDRLVLPVPADDVERERWRHPSPKEPTESWDPDRLTALLKILGTQNEKGKDGARLVWEAPWSADRWQYEKQRLAAAEVVGADAFWSTRRILAMDDQLPSVVEAVAAFPSAEQCRHELSPVDTTTPPGKMTAACALITLARPLLIPTSEEGQDFRPLREAIDLAEDDDFKKARAAYYGWMRAFVIKKGELPLDLIWLNEADVRLAREELADLIRVERSIVKQHGKKRGWTVVEYATTILSVGATVALATLNPLAWLGVGGTILGFGGWVASKRSAPDPAAAPLTGASMFMTPHKRLGWVTASPSH